MAHRITIPMFILTALFAAGCHTTERITLRPALVQACSDQDALDILLSDSSLLHLTAYTITDSTLFGRGMRQIHGAVVPFEGSVPFRDIQYVETREVAGFSTILALGAAGYVVGSAISVLQEPEGRSIVLNDVTVLYDPRRQYSSGGGGHSCPTLYAWDGSRFILEGEAFAVAWGKALEMTTCTLLPSLRPENGLLHVQVRNERPETHYHNSLNLLSAEVPEEASVVSDIANRLLVLDHPAGPTVAVDDARPGLQDALSCADGVFWNSTRSTAHAGGSYTDKLQLSFVTPSRAGAGVLVVTAVNTEIFASVLSHLSNLLGDATLDFVQALEHDPEMIQLISEWLDEAALRVWVSDGTTWREAGKILPEANAIPFTRAVQLDMRDCGETVLVRLECLSDVWNIDAVLLDRTAPCVLPWTRISCESASTGTDGDIAEYLCDRDERYVVTLPTERIDLSFHCQPSRPGMRRVYGLEATGYLHEWMPTRKEGLQNSLIHRSDRITCIKELLRHRGLLLPPIYASWGSR